MSEGRIIQIGEARIPLTWVLLGAAALGLIPGASSFVANRAFLPDPIMNPAIYTEEQLQTEIKRRDHATYINGSVEENKLSIKAIAKLQGSLVIEQLQQAEQLDSVQFDLSEIRAVLDDIAAKLDANGGI